MCGYNKKEFVYFNLGNGLEQSQNMNEFLKNYNKKIFRRDIKLRMDEF